MRRTLCMGLVLIALGMAGCKQPVDAIGLSSLTLDFGAEGTAATLEVWNTNTQIPLLPVAVASSAPWLIPGVDVLYAPGPKDTTAEYEKQELALTVERRLLTGGAKSAVLTFSSLDVVTRSVFVTIEPPYEAIGISTLALNFGEEATVLPLSLWNANPNAGPVTMTIASSAAWLTTLPQTVTSQAPGSLNAPFDTKNVTVHVDRDLLDGGPAEASLEISAPGYATKTVTVSIFQPYDAIAVSNADLEVGLSTIPQHIEVWNQEMRLESVVIQVTPEQPWIQVAPASVVSGAPAKAMYDKKEIVIKINRALLDAGDHEADVVFSAEHCLSQSMRVHVSQDENSHYGPLTVTNLEEKFASPYLVEFHFSLQDETGAPVSAAPAEFTLAAAENRVSGGSSAVGAEETGLLLRKETASQQKVDFVLDYSLSMQHTAGAVEAMENAVKNVLLPALKEDAQAGVVEFHREDVAPQRAAEFSVDRAYTAARIDAIQSEYVNGFASASIEWDALLFSLESYSVGNAANEIRYIILVSDGRDTSSQGSIEDVVDEALARQVKIYAVAFGANPDYNDLDYIASGTGGRLLPAQTIYALGDAAEDIVNDFASKYVLRWASLTRNDSLQFTPSFSVTLDGDTANYESDTVFKPSDWDSTSSLEGQLRLETTETDANAVAFLRAEYMPRGISALHIFVKTDNVFTAALTDAADNGLLAGWTLTTTDAPESGGVWLEMATNGGALPFAAFGPLLRLNFSEASSGGALIEDVYVDSGIYENGQTFVVQGYPNTPPAG